MSADPNTGVLELRNEGHLEQWGMQVLQLVPAEALQQQVRRGRYLPRNWNVASYDSQPSTSPDNLAPVFPPLFADCCMCAAILLVQVLGVVCSSGSDGARWLSANGTPLVDPKVQTMVKLVKQVREVRTGGEEDGVKQGSAFAGHRGTQPTAQHCRAFQCNACCLR